MPRFPVQASRRGPLRTGSPRLLWSNSGRPENSALWAVIGRRNSSIESDFAGLSAVQRDLYDSAPSRIVIDPLAAFLHGSPALCLFLSILLGTIIGRFHFKGVGFGAVVGTLIAGIVIGIFARPELPDLLRWAFFYLFLFAIGYSVGPQFFGSLKKEALPADHAGARRGRDRPGDGDRRHAASSASTKGIAVGLLSGGMTQSAALGTGLSAIAELPIADGDKGHAHGQRAAGRRDHLRLRRSRPDPVPHVARTEAACARI